jgi:protein-S-isoprenylcysteine O-methyltransferase Ste14
VAYVLYGGVCYLVTVVTLLYAIAFVAGAPVPRTVDAGGPASAAGTALLVDVLLLVLFAVQHSGMARRGFKAVWTRLVPKPIERSTYVLAASACLLLLFTLWRPIPRVVWSVEAPSVRFALLAVSALGWFIALFSTFLINHFELFGLRQVYLAARRKERLHGLAEEIQARGPGKALPVVTDVSQLGEIQNLVDVTLKNFGQINILFNNAGFGRLDWLDSLAKMNEDAIVFAMANPTPEVMPEEAEPHVRIMATGRSDYPNQINNVLCFPGLFRGALDAGAPRITEEMKLAAARGIAEVVTEDDLAEDYIIPSVFNRDVAPAVAQAVVEEAKEAGLARFSEETGTFEIVDGASGSGNGSDAA